MRVSMKNGRLAVYRLPALKGQLHKQLACLHICGSGGEGGERNKAEFIITFFFFLKACTIRSLSNILSQSNTNSHKLHSQRTELKIAGPG